MRNLILSLTLISVAGTANVAFAKRSRDVPAARETGVAKDCIRLTDIRETRVRSDSVIDFRTSARQWYRNTLPYRCPSLGFEERFSYSTSLSQLCSVDTITVLHSAAGLSRGASCGLGKFQPVEIAKR